MVRKAFCLIHYALHTKYCTHIVWHGSTNMLWLRNNHYYTLNDNFNVHNIIKTSCGFQPWLENWLKMIDSNEPSSSDGQTDQDCEQCRVKPISKNPDEWSDPLTGSNLYRFDVFKIHIAVFSTHLCAWDYFWATLIFQSTETKCNNTIFQAWSTQQPQAWSPRRAETGRANSSPSQASWLSHSLPSISRMDFYILVINQCVFTYLHDYAKMNACKHKTASQDALEPFEQP